jgi:circadian clock protein KaiB
VTDTAPADRWVLTLYVNGGSTYSMQAIEAVRRLCDEELDGHFDLEVVDVRQHAALVVSDQVIATPTLVKRLPAPLRRIVGNLSDSSRLRFGLGLGTVGASDGQRPGDKA